MSLQDIREQRSVKVSEARALLTAAGDRALTADETAKFDSLKSEITALEAAEARQQFRR